MAYISFEPSDHFNTVLYTGNATDDRSISGVGFQPDWVWGKDRSAARSYEIYDSSRGATLRIQCDNNNAESTQANNFQAFESDGFQVGSGPGLNADTYTFSAWCWKMNGGTTASNSDGSITSTVQANTTAGMSIVTYTGTGSAATVGHGLGATPNLIIIKNRNADPASYTTQWHVYSTSPAGNGTGNASRLDLDDNGASIASANNNSTSPTSSVFSIGATNMVGDSFNYVAYCFAEKTGFSRFGYYTGNGSADGPFNYCGFKPAWVMVKNRDATENWYLQDNKRDTINPNNNAFNPDINNAENELSAYDIDLLSNGFKIRNTNTQHNSSGYNYVFWAFADTSLVASTGLPTTAK